MVSRRVRRPFSDLGPGPIGAVTAHDHTRPGAQVPSGTTYRSLMRRVIVNERWGGRGGLPAGRGPMERVVMKAGRAPRWAMAGAQGHQVGAAVSALRSLADAAPP